MPQPGQAADPPGLTVANVIPGEAEALLPCGLDLVIVARSSILQIKSPELTALLAGKGLRQIRATVVQDPQKS